MIRWLKIVFIFLLVIAGRNQVSAQVTPDTTYTTVEDDEVLEEMVVDAPVERTPTTYTAPTVFNTDKPSDKEWNDLVTDKAFSYKDQKEFKPTKKAEPKKQREVQHRDPVVLNWILNFFQFLGSTVGLVIMGMLVIGVLLFIAYRLISGEGRLFAKTSKPMKSEEAVVAEEDLLSNDWEIRFRAAMQANDVRMAVRYSYMMVLQMLQNRELIAYRQDKTNIEYFRELETGEIKTYFRQMMRQYEYTWYGNYLPAQSAFESYIQAYDSLKIKLKTW